MKKQRWSRQAAFAVLALAPVWALAGPGSAVHIDSVGFDVAKEVFVIHGTNFVIDETPTAPRVEVGGVEAEVESFSGGFITVRKPSGLPAGEHRITVERHGLTDEPALDASEARAEVAYTLSDVVPPEPSAVSSRGQVEVGAAHKP